jgi:hypothetical protein
MQELSKNFREAGLHIFRHRRGMLFVSSIRPRPFVYDETTVSPQVRAILETIAATSRIHRKDLADKLFETKSSDDPETRKLGLASDLRWLINEGYVIEFNDGSLDLPRVKTKGASETTNTDVVAATAKSSESPVAANDSTAEAATLIGSTESRPTGESAAPASEATIASSADESQA